MSVITMCCHLTLPCLHIEAEKRVITLMYQGKQTNTHTRRAHTFRYSNNNLLRKPALRGLICASVPSLVKFKRVNKSLPPEQPSSSPFHVHICSLYVQKSTEARPDSVGIGLAEELEAFQLLASVVPLPRAAGSQLMAMPGTQRGRTVADFPIAIAPIPAHHQLQMSHQQLGTFGLMLRFSESWGQMFLTLCALSHNSTLSTLSLILGYFTASGIYGTLPTSLKPENLKGTSVIPKTSQNL